MFTIVHVSIITINSSSFVALHLPPFELAECIARSVILQELQGSAHVWSLFNRSAFKPFFSRLCAYNRFFST